MEITKIEVIPIYIPLVETFMTSRGVWKSEYAIVRITTDEGIVGIGDAGIPKPTHYGESLGTMMEMINNWLGPALLGEDPFNIEKIIHKMDSIACWHWIAKTAIDYALHDILGKALNVPLYKLLGGLAREKVPLQWLVRARSAKEASIDAEEAIKALEAGFHELKLKVGLYKPEDDVERVKVVRDAVGNDVPLLVDANQAWTPDVAIRTIRKMKKYDLCMVEQPVPDWDLFGLAKVHRSVNVPIVADESARSIEGAINVIRMDAADIFRLHVAKAGGIFKSRQYIAIAEAADMPVKLGLMVGGGIETAVSAHLGVAIEWLGKYAHSCIGPLIMFGGFDTDHIKEDIVHGQPARIKGGYLYPPEVPGLGVELDEEMVKKYLIPRQKILVCEKKG